MYRSELQSKSKEVNEKALAAARQGAQYKKIVDKLVAFLRIGVLSESIVLFNGRKSARDIKRCSAKKFLKNACWPLLQ